MNTQHSSASQMQTRIEGLDALRGYTAIMVLAFHAFHRVQAPYLKGGYLGVDLFFVLSGFVIAYVYDRKMEEMGFRRFIAYRLIRFYPLYLIGTLLGLALYAVYLLFGRGVHFTWFDVVALTLIPNLLFLPSFSAAMGKEIFLNGPAWSLMFELLINILYGLFFRFLSMAVLFAVTGISALGLIWFAFSYNSLDGGGDQPALLVGLARVSFSFPAGVLLYRLRHRLPDLARLGPAVPFILVAACWSPPSALRDLAFILVLSPLLTIVAQGATPALPRLAAFLAVISYGLYIIHEPLLLLTTAFTNRFGLHPEATMAIVVAGVIILSAVLDRAYDIPMRRWALRRTGLSRR